MATDVTVNRQNIRYTTTLETTICCECGCPFAIPADMLADARGNAAKRFCCPNGHSLGFFESEADKLRKRLDRSERLRDSLSAALTAEQDQHRAAKRQAAAYKGQLTRARKRAGAGVCPVTECHRTVSQLADHMKTKHPDFQA